MSRLPRFTLHGTAAVLLCACLLLFAATASADFGIQPGSFQATLSTTQAGAHPDLTTSFSLNRRQGGQIGEEVVGLLKDTTVDLPAGLIGDTTAVARCGYGQLARVECPPQSWVGMFSITLEESTGMEPGYVPLYNMQPFEGRTAELGAMIFIGHVPFQVRVRDEGDYGLQTTVRNAITTFPAAGAGVELWGIPADHNGGGGPRRPYLTNPSTCGTLPPAHAQVTSWPTLDVPQEMVSEASADPWTITGCENLPPVLPQIGVEPEEALAGAPSGYDLDLDVNDNPDPDGIAVPPLKEVSLTLPEGTAISPAAADGLAACTDEQFGIGTRNAPACPEASKIGTVSVDTPLLADPLTGSMFVGESKPGDKFRLFLLARGSGVTVRVRGSAQPDPNTGRITATFDELPQVPFTHLHVHLKGGPRAVLVNPRLCGEATSSVAVTPYGGGAAGTATSSFSVDGGCSGGGFAPQLVAGTTNPVAGEFSPFSLRLTRSDDEAELRSLSELTLPPGLLASLKGIPYCPEEALAAAGDCPAASQVGTATVGAGAGSNPFYVSGGKVYLGGPYKGAPLSLAVSVPAVAGPFDLGTVVVRSALHVDPETTQLTAATDPFPTILEGVPLQLRDVRLAIDRSHFTVNPTDCKPMQVRGTAVAVGGATAAVGNRFQVGDCAALGFKPKLSLRFLGATRRSAHPKLRAVLRARKGDANIGKAVVTLPKSQFLENKHIRTICTRVQYAADSCPKDSIYGYAKAWSPLLDQPLQGPVYLRSSDHALPDLVASLDGQIHIDLAGRIDSVHGRMRTTFESVPDAPVSRFVLQMQGGKKGLLVNSTDLCAATPRAKVALTGQNGRSQDASPVVRTDCRKHHRRR